MNPTHTINCRSLSTILCIRDIESVDYLTVRHAEFLGYGQAKLRKPLYVIRIYLRNDKSHTFIYDSEADWRMQRTQLEAAINRAI